MAAAIVPPCATSVASTGDARLSPQTGEPRRAGDTAREESAIYGWSPSPSGLVVGFGWQRGDDRVEVGVLGVVDLRRRGFAHRSPIGAAQEPDREQDQQERQDETEGDA